MPLGQGNGAPSANNSSWRNLTEPNQRRLEMHLPRWAWAVIAIAIILIVMAVLKVNVSVGSGGIHATQELVR